MAAHKGPVRYAKRTSPTLLSVACLVIVAVTAACGSAPPQGTSVGKQPANGPLSASAEPWTGAGLSRGMALASAPSVPSAPAGHGADECLPQRAEDSVANGMLECEYFTSGSLMPASVPRGPGMSSGDYAIRFGIVGGHPLMTVRIPCASYAVRITIVGEIITPDPGTLESYVDTCTFPWDQERARMERYLQAPLQFARRESGIVLHNPEWGITLFGTPYDAT